MLARFNTAAAAHVAALIATAALGLSVYAATTSTPSLGTVSVSQLAHDKLVEQAKAAGVKLLWDKVIAYRVTGDTSVARVRLRYEYDTFNLKTGLPDKGTETIVVVFHFTRSQWQIDDGKKAS